MSALGDPSVCCSKCHDTTLPANPTPMDQINHARFIVCTICGNKRCPHATDHELPCTNSNEPGQKGSRYE
jgi:hypothetical protein